MSELKRGINGIIITDVIVFPLKQPTNTTKAFAKVVFNDQFIVSGIKIVKGANGHFVSFPQEASKDKSTFYDICFPTTAELRNYISDHVLDQYKLSISLAMKGETV